MSSNDIALVAIAKILERRGMWTPFPGPQTIAYSSLADETFYGGAAGGGKTDLLLGVALTAHKNSIIFRREYPQLKTIIERSRSIILKKNLLAKYNKTEKIWNLGNDKYLEFGACQHEDDWEKYQGRPHDLKAFDEITHFSKNLYKKLSGWNRTDDFKQRTRIICTGNPPTTAEGRWVIDYWSPWLDPKHPNPAKPGELRYFVMIADDSSPEGREVEVGSPEPVKVSGFDEPLIPRSRTFIPARVDDNPVYVKTGYKSVLMSMPEPLRSQMLLGDFVAGIEDDEWQVLPTEWVRAAMRSHSHQINLPMTALGCDVARGGAAKTVFAPRYGNIIAPLRKYPGKSTPNGSAIAELFFSLLEPSAYGNIDVCGVGSSPYDSCVERGLNVFAANAAEKSNLKDKAGIHGFINKRAEWYWKFRELLDPASGQEIVLPDDPELLADLTAPRWKLTTRSQIQIELKSDIVKRLGRSPDCGDAVVLAFAQIEIQGFEISDEVSWGY